MRYGIYGFLWHGFVLSFNIHSSYDQVRFTIKTHWLIIRTTSVKITEVSKKL